MDQDLAILAFNRGLVSRLGLARADVKRIAMSAEQMVNCMPRVLGSMMLRPGLGYTGATRSNLLPYNIPFIFSIGDTADLELTDLFMRVWIGDSLVTRPSVTTAVTNGTFPANFGSWTDNDEAGATSAWISAGLVGFTGTGSNAAIRDQQVTVAGANIGVEHALRIVVERGPLTLRVGSSSGGDQYISETSLGTGTHSLAFTPTGDFYIRFLSRLARIVRLSQCTVEGAGVMTVPTPWVEADLRTIRYDQSGDVVFCAADGYQQRRIERRAAHSWSVVRYQPEDGPFRTENIGPITMTPSVISGNGTLTASAASFKATNVGGLFSVTSTGQTVTKSMAALNDATNAMRVVGVSTDRAFTINISGVTAIGAGRTVILQRSFDNSTWAAVSGKSWTADTVEGYGDGLDNQEVWYRLLLSVVGGAGTNTAILSIATGSITGIGRVTGFTSETVVDVEVLSDFGGTTASDTWAEGQWSDRRGWPSAVAFTEGRLFWAGKDKVNGSISDAFDGFDPEFEGDAGTIQRSIGSGPVDTINWLLALERLIIGAQGAEFCAKSSSLDEPLTPTNFNMKPSSRQGSAAVQAVAIDANGIYVQRGGVRVFELSIDPSNGNYGSTHLSAIVPEIGEPGIVRMAVQRQPDTRVHFIRSDGTVAVLVFDRTENVTCWLEIETDGEVEDVLILPGDEGDSEDFVYYFVKRTINGSDVRYRERWAIESDCQGSTLNKQADSFVTFTNATPSATVTGLTHLIGEDVVCWQDGTCELDSSDDPVTFTVNGAGEITLNSAASTGVVGLPYTAPWQSGKLLGLQSQRGTMLTHHKEIKTLGVIAADLHPKGLKYGPDFDNLQSMPEVEGGTTINPDTVRSAYDEEPFTFPGEWSTDSRLCLQMQAPLPCTLLAVVIDADLVE